MKMKSFVLAFLCAAALGAASVEVQTTPCLIVRGEDCWIEWTVSGMTADKVNISVLQGNTAVQQFLNVANAPGQNQKTWHVPASLAPGTYKFRVAAAGAAGVQGECVREIRDRGIYINPNTFSGTLALGDKVPATYWAFGFSSNQVVYFDLYRNGTLVGIAAANFTHDHFHFCEMPVTWTVGQLVDEEYWEPLAEKAPPGTGYKIRLRVSGTGGYFADAGTFTIARRFDPSGIRDLSKDLVHIPVWPVPGCPMCGEVQMQELWKIFESSPDVREIQLWQGGRLLARLAERGAAARRLAGRRVEFGGSFAQLRKGGAGFELRLFAAGNRLLRTQAVILDFKAR
jgi:hypothetical protein